ncbi:MAG: hypothetical protein WCA08_17825 [Desulfoferrobacter sp.]
MEMTERPTGVVVCDSGPIIHLDELGCLDLLEDFPRVLVPHSVWEEVQSHRPRAFSRPNVSLEQVRMRQVNDLEVETVSELFTLHQGERDALLIIREFSAGMFLTDDTAARLAARNLGVAVHGTIGILVRSIRKMTRTKAEVIDLLESIPQKSTLFIKRALLDDIVAQVQREASPK